MRDRPSAFPPGRRPDAARPRVGRAWPPDALLPPRRFGSRALVRRGRARFRRPLPRALARPAGPWREPVGVRARVRHRGLRPRPGRRHGCPRLAPDDRDRPLHGRPQRDGVRGLASGARRSAGRGGQPPGHPGRAPSEHAPARRSRADAPRDARLRAQELPAPARETVADPRLLEHLARAGITEREGRFLYRFDPACNGRRRPTDGWALLDRITAQTLLVRGEHSPILPREMAAEMLARLAHARLVEIPGTYHHLVLDAPGAFARALEDFLSQPIPST